MANPVPVTYNAAASPVVGGRYVWPAWRHALAPGTFTNISNNTFASVRPSSWGAGDDVSGPFSNWTGAVYAPDVGGRHGSWVIHGSGHLSAGTVVWGGVWGFDLESGLWSGYNVPPSALIEGASYNEYFESTDPANAGHTYAPHTYDGLIYQPPAMGGPALIRHCMPGSGISGERCAHRFDFSASNPPTRVLDNLASISTSYPATAYDSTRGGYWAISANGAGSLAFVSLPSFAVTTYAKTFGAYGDHSLTYLPPPYDCLVTTGRFGSGGAEFALFVCPIVAGAPVGWTKATASGTPPARASVGSCYSTVLDCLVMYQGRGSYTVEKIAIPENLTTGTWEITTEILTGVAGATPSYSGGTGGGDGGWSKFIEIPRLRCFAYCDGVSQPFQAWRLQGM